MTRKLVISSVVEGHGETYALPILIRRIAGEMFGAWDVRIPTPHRVPRGRMVTSEMTRQQHDLRRSGAGHGGCP